MKTIALILATIALAYPELLAQKQTTQPLKTGKQVLFDFRVERRSVPPRIPAAIQRSVLSKVFTKYLTDESRCNSQFDAGNVQDHLKAARDAGQIVPLILETVTGSFTAPGRPETLYVISVSECNASHAENFGTKRVAIFAGQEIVANVDADFKSGIARKMDLNGDGLDELLMTSSDMNQGIVIEIGALVDFRNGRLRVIEDFGTVIEDSCASGIPGSSSKASVVSIAEVTPGKIPRLRLDNFEAGCRKMKRWKFLSTGKTQE
jgi:hypothetical protein